MNLKNMVLAALLALCAQNALAVTCGASKGQKDQTNSAELELKSVGGTHFSGRDNELSIDVSVQGTNINVQIRELQANSLISAVGALNSDGQFFAVLEKNNQHLIVQCKK